jgi:hypothetical protein
MIIIILTPIFDFPGIKTWLIFLGKLPSEAITPRIDPWSTYAYDEIPVQSKVF